MRAGGVSSKWIFYKFCYPCAPRPRSQSYCVAKVIAGEREGVGGGGGVKRAAGGCCVWRKGIINRELKKSVSEKYVLIITNGFTWTRE